LVKEIQKKLDTHYDAIDTTYDEIKANLVEIVDELDKESIVANVKKKIGDKLMLLQQTRLGKIEEKKRKFGKLKDKLDIELREMFDKKAREIEERTQKGTDEDVRELSYFYDDVDVLIENINPALINTASEKGKIKNILDRIGKPRSLLESGFEKIKSMGSILRRGRGQGRGGGQVKKRKETRKKRKTTIHNFDKSQYTQKRIVL
jgi:hypothetical protein